MMTEQISKLALQCGAWHQVYGNRNFMIDEHFDIAKFAELIVRECGKVIVNGGYRNPALGEKHPLTPPEIAKMIREHFGVEE